MNPSPIRTLVARHTCACRPTSAPRALTFTRPLSNTSRLHEAVYNPPAGFGSSEELRRRYKPRPASVLDARAQRTQAVRRMRNATFGILGCAVGLAGTIYFYSDVGKENKTDNNVVKLDSPQIPGVPEPTTIADQTDQIPTGTSTIPFFPRTIHLSSSTTSTQPPNNPLPSGGTPPLPQSITSGDTEYQLLGLGIRTVSFLSIEVYVVGLYIAVQDIATLQQRLIRQIDPVATTLVPNEKAKLNQLLLDPVKGEKIWNEILSDASLRTAFRIVPTRNTDWMHMRDGFVRGITARSSHFSQDLKDSSFQDDVFGASINDFKAVFAGGSGGRKKIPWGETLYLLRDQGGKFSAVHEDKKGDRFHMGDVGDERVSRLLWLGYLAGGNVSSEPARKSVVEGCVEVCGRPVGTVAEQVV